MKRLICLALLLMGMNAPASAQTSYAYYGFEPDIVTNYISPSAKKLGYIRVTIELMITDAGDLGTLEHHSPLLRATTIEILGRQPEGKIKSLTGREDIRRTILDNLKELLRQETGKEIVKDVIFTKYLYQGG